MPPDWRRGAGGAAVRARRSQCCRHGDGEAVAQSAAAADIGPGAGRETKIDAPSCAWSSPGGVPCPDTLAFLWWRSSVMWTRNAGSAAWFDTLRRQAYAF